MNNRFPITTALALAGFVAGCSPAAQNDADANEVVASSPSATATATPAIRHAEWAGKWIGVEGMFVEITPAENGSYSLIMQSDLDTAGTYIGTDAEGGIAFERGGQQLLLKAATGDQTKLKYLAGKSDCLMVAAGEGYCRD
jgi:hypothetical protein